MFVKRCGKAVDNLKTIWHFLLKNVDMHIYCGLNPLRLRNFWFCNRLRFSDYVSREKDRCFSTTFLPANIPCVDK